MAKGRAKACVDRKNSIVDNCTKGKAIKGTHEIIPDTFILMVVVHALLVKTITIIKESLCNTRMKESGSRDCLAKEKHRLDSGS